MRYKKSANLMADVFDGDNPELCVYQPEYIDLGIYGQIRYIESTKMYFCANDMTKVWEQLDEENAKYKYYTFFRKFRIPIKGFRGVVNRDVTFMCELDVFTLHCEIADGPFKRFLGNLIDEYILPYHKIDRATWNMSMERDYNDLYLNSLRSVYGEEYNLWTENIHKYVEYLADVSLLPEKKVLSNIYNDISKYIADLGTLITDYRKQRKQVYLRNGYTLYDYNIEMKAFSTLCFIYQRRDLREQFEFCVKKQAMENGYIEKGGLGDKLVSQ